MSACQSDEFPTGTDIAVDSQSQIKITGLRSIDPRSIATTDDIWVWVGKNSDDDFAKTWHLTTTDGSTFSGTTKYWPGDGSPLSFKALHGNFTTSPTENTTPWSSLSLTHTVANDQSDDAARAKSDLLYADVPSVTSGTNVNLQFKHLLAKITVVLKKKEGSGISDDVLQNATATLSGAARTTTFKSADLSTVSSGGAQTISMGGSGNVREAIIPCQSATLTLQVTLNNFPESSKSRTFVCDLSLTSFTKGMNYQYTLTLNNNVSIALSSISQWIDDTIGIVIPPADVEGD